MASEQAQEQHLGNTVVHETPRSKGFAHSGRPPVPASPLTRDVMLGCLHDLPQHPPRQPLSPGLEATPRQVE